MRFKILPNTPTYRKLTALIEKMRQANKEAMELATSLGAEQWCQRNDFQDIAGGISGLQFKEKPKGWVNVYTRSCDDVYFPSKRLKANKELIKKIEQLPTVSSYQLNQIVGYQPQCINTNRGVIMATFPGFKFTTGNYLLSFHENAEYKTANPDIVEITLSEYKALAEEDAS